MELLVFDNYDSFTYNIVHAFRSLGLEPVVKRNNDMNVEEVERYDKIVISPGPGIPSESGILSELLQKWIPFKPILGVCLGHQAIGESCGATLKNLTDVYHGVATNINILSNDYLFDGLPDKFKVGRYHSWVIDENNFPENVLDITARDDRGLIMAIKHKKFDVHGVQFHPESILTPDGMKIIENWLNH